jgi:hypothetical protein
MCRQRIVYPVQDHRIRLVARRLVMKQLHYEARHFSVDVNHFGRFSIAERDDERLHSVSLAKS